MISQIFCWLGRHEYIHVKNVSYLEYMGMALGDMAGEISTNDLLSMMSEALQHVGINERESLGLDSYLNDYGYEKMTPHVEFIRKLQLNRRTLMHRYDIAFSSSTRDKIIDELQDIKKKIVPMFWDFKIRFCCNCRTTFDPRLRLTQIISGLCTGLRQIKLDEQAGRYSI